MRIYFLSPVGSKISSSKSLPGLFLKNHVNRLRRWIEKLKGFRSSGIQILCCYAVSLLYGNFPHWILRGQDFTHGDLWNIVPMEIYRFRFFSVGNVLVLCSTFVTAFIPVCFIFLSYALCILSTIWGSITYKLEERVYMKFCTKKREFIEDICDHLRL